LEPLLSFAEELERRDAAVAHALTGVEQLQRDIEELRTRADVTAAFLAQLPRVRVAREADEQAAARAVGDAEAMVREAELRLAAARKDDERVAAERERQQARAGLAAAARWSEQAREAREQLEREGAARHAERGELESRAAELAPRVRDVPLPPPGLHGVLEWTARARGALLLERSGLMREREELVREANEFVASVLGDPLATTSVAGIRHRLGRAVGGTDEHRSANPS
jgi:hypothetical protein